MDVLDRQQDADNGQLAVNVSELRDEVNVLWHAIDELREVFEYAVRNGREVPWLTGVRTRLVSITKS